MAYNLRMKYTEIVLTIPGDHPPGEIFTVRQVMRAWAVLAVRRAGSKYRAHKMLGISRPFLDVLLKERAEEEARVEREEASQCQSEPR